MHVNTILEIKSHYKKLYYALKRFDYTILLSSVQKLSPSIYLNRNKCAIMPKNIICKCNHCEMFLVFVMNYDEISQMEKLRIILEI